MNLPSFSNFLEFEIKGLILVVPSLSLPTEADRWVLATSTATLVVDQVKIFDRPGKLTAGGQSSTAAMVYCPRRCAVRLFQIGTSQGTIW
jgi:hypothetical protein